MYKNSKNKNITSYMEYMQKVANNNICEAYKEYVQMSAQKKLVFSCPCTMCANKTCRIHQEVIF